MRIWSLHPQYLDAKGLVALWRETLLAQNVLLGKTKGYRNHPQLDRFKKTDDPVAAIGNYLHQVADEADRRDYNFNREKIISLAPCRKIPVTAGQLAYEFGHLLNKLQVRDAARFDRFKTVDKIRLHPLFRRKPGDVEDWEVINPPSGK